MGWLHEYAWVIGIVYLFCGPLIAFFGGKWFQYIFAALFGLYSCYFFCIISLSAGWMESAGWATAVIITAIILGIVAGLLVR